MKKSEPIRLGELLDRWITEEPEIHEKLMETKLLQRLPEVLASYDRYVAGAYVSDGVLHLKIHSSAVRGHLLMLRNDLLIRLNELVGVELLRDIDIR